MFAKKSAIAEINVDRLNVVKCIFKFYLARVNSIPVEFTSAWIFPSSFYKILLQMIPCLCRRRIK